MVHNGATMTVQSRLNSTEHHRTHLLSKKSMANNATPRAVAPFVVLVILMLQLLALAGRAVLPQ